MNELKNPIYIRGDYHVCPTPVALDPYYGCRQRCIYCFCRELEHRFSKENFDKNLVKNANLETLEKILKLAYSEKETSNPLVSAIREGFPIAVGKKSEPFQPVELQRKVTLNCLKILKEYSTPTIIETKHIYLSRDEYLKIISEMDVAINVSIISGSNSIISLLEPNAPMPMHRWKLVALLKSMGFHVGVRNEPLLMSIGSSDKSLRNYANLASNYKVDHVNFGNYRVFDRKMAYDNFKKIGLEKKYVQMLKANETKSWRKVGEKLFELLHKNNIKVTSSDWDVFHDLNDCENCCGIDHKFQTYNRFTFQTALRILRNKKSVRFDDIVKYAHWLGKREIEKVRAIWNRDKKTYYTLSDAIGVTPMGRDENGNIIYGRRRDLKEVFG